MLGEWFTHLTTPCGKPYRRMGYLHELIAIDHRYKRCRAAWAPHLEQCQSLITEAAAACPHQGRAVVLGSGLLLDIPLTYLATTFDDVVLIDICHLRSTRSLVKKYQNVRLIEADISGSVDPLLYWLSGDQNMPLPTPNIDTNLLGGADYIISSNLLAQLPLTPLTHLTTHAPDLDPAALNTIARTIIDHHLSLLQSQNCPVTLISETLRLFSNQSAAATKIDPLFGAPLNYNGAEWWWDIAPKPELDAQTSLRLSVRGIKNLTGADSLRYCRNTAVERSTNK